MNWNKIILIVFALLGVAGAALSVAMLISAINFSEWGRVILYCVTLAVCVELTVRSIMKLKPENSEE